MGTRGPTVMHDQERARHRAALNTLLRRATADYECYLECATTPAGDFMDPEDKQQFAEEAAQLDAARAALRYFGLLEGQE